MADDEITQSGSFLSRLLRERTAVAGVLSVLAILLAGWAIPDFEPGRVRYSGLLRQEYWRIKMNWRHCADIVLAGDSRIQVGVSPEQMNRQLPGLRIINYGFGRVGYSQEYLRAVEALLDPAGSDRIIVLGVTPSSLLQVSQQNNVFLEKLRRRRTAGEAGSAEVPFWKKHFPVCHRFLQPRRGLRDVQLTFGKDKLFMEFFADGWLATYAVPPDPDGGGRTYRAIFAKHKVQPESIDRLLKAVRRWRREGITVYGVRVPTRPRLLALENELSGLDAELFQAAFEQAGGRWLSFDGEGYRCYDGSHLDRRSARRFSEALARQLAADRD